MEFTAYVDEHTITLDTSPKFGGKNKGVLPKPLLMVSLAGCTAMDVISILNKMKTDLTYFNVIVDGELADEHPMIYKKLHIIYEFSGNNLNLANIEKAVNLSITKYCGVYATLIKAVEITHEIKII
jgi:putative redox protein